MRNDVESKPVQFRSKFSRSKTLFSAINSKSKNSQIAITYDENKYNRKE